MYWSSNTIGVMNIDRFKRDKLCLKQNEENFFACRVSATRMTDSVHSMSKEMYTAFYKNRMKKEKRALIHVNLNENA